MELTDSTGDEWIYSAAADSFSYYTVRGINHESEDQNDTASQNQSSEDQTAPVCGDSICQANESWESCSSDCQKPEEAVSAENAISDAEEEISEGEKGYKRLQEAKTHFESEEYSEAERLAQNVLERYRSDRSGDTPWILIGARFSASFYSPRQVTLATGAGSNTGLSRRSRKSRMI